MNLLAVVFVALALASQCLAGSTVKGVNVQGRIFGHGNDCNGCCKIGEGDCDGNGDCCSGLVCVDDSWHDYDHCEPGPNTVHAHHGEWSEWTACDYTCGVQDTQTRSRSCVPPQNGGHSCDHENIPQSQTESRSCAVFTCGQWGAWSLSCGGAATRTRSRTCSTNAGDGPCPDEGEKPDLYADEISEPEDKDACWSEFGDWGDCSVSCGGTGTRTKSKSCIEPDQGSGGLPCPSQNTQEASESCDAPACWTDFGEWGQCTVACGGNGTQTRSKSCIEPSNGGLACPDSDVEEESQVCQAPACWTDYGAWGECSVSCGGTGTQIRTKTCIEPGEGNGLPCPAENSKEEAQSCDAPACWTEYGDWGDCSVSCGGTGTQTRSKSCIEPTDGGLACPDENVEEESQSCDAPACWTAFSEWTACEGVCGQNGTQARERTCIEPTDGGLSCPEETTETETQSCDTIGLSSTWN